MPKHSKPKSPEQIMADRRAEAVQRADAASDAARFALASNENVRVATDPRGKRFAAFRSDVFDLLLGRQALTDVQHQAARRLQVTIATAAGVGGAGPSLELVDGASGDREQVNGRMIAAGRELLGHDPLGVLHRLPERSRKLLLALIEPTVIRGQVSVWRAVVQRETGVAEPHVQTDRVVCACEDLAAAWRARDAEPRRAA